jgi:hypothetical protein
VREWSAGGTGAEWCPVSWAKPDIDTQVGLFVGRDVEVMFRTGNHYPVDITLVGAVGVVP